MKAEEDPTENWPNELKVNHFRVPDKYFESLPSLIQERVRKKRSIEIFSIFRKIAFNPGFSAAILCFGLLFYFSIHKMNKSLPSKSSVEMNIENQIDEETLIEGYSASDNGSDHSQDQASEYLIENHLDISTLTNDETL